MAAGVTPCDEEGGNVIAAHPTLIDPRLVRLVVASWPPVALPVTYELLVQLLAALSAVRSMGALDECTRASGGNTYWVPIVTSWLDDLDAAVRAGAGIDWLDGPHDTLGRWAAVTG